MFEIFLCVMNAAGQNNSYTEQIWTTAIALAYMSLALAQLQTSWMLVAKKAEKWLHSQPLSTFGRRSRLQDGRTRIR